MKLLALLFTNLFAFFLLTRVRQVVTVTLMGAVAFTIVAPPARAQLGIPAIIAAAAQVVATINNVIGPLFSAIRGTFGAINGVLNQFRNLWEQIVYPLQLINRARALVLLCYKLLSPRRLARGCIMRERWVLLRPLSDSLQRRFTALSLLRRFSTGRSRLYTTVREGYCAPICLATTSPVSGECSVISTGEKPRADHCRLAVMVSGAAWR